MNFSVDAPYLVNKLKFYEILKYRNSLHPLVLSYYSSFETVFHP